MTVPKDSEDSDRALRDSEIRYRRLFEAAQDGILLLDATSGAITDVNPFLIKLLGYTHGEFLGKELWEIGLCRDIAESKRLFDELQRLHYVQYDDLPLKSKSGQSISVEFVSNVYQEDHKQVIQCNIRDITRRKDAEQIQEKAQQGQKMEAVGQLAGGVAHDFNNLLGVILGYCELLDKQKDLRPSVRKMIGEISNAGNCAKDLTRQLLAFSRRQVVQPVFLDLNSVVTRVGTMLNRLIGDDIELVTLLGNDLGTVKIDPNQLEQVLMNLTVNARDAMPQGGKLTLSTSVIDGASDKRYILLTVADDGVGMDEATRSRIFEPFFSTKGASGTGLGLSTVLGIVEKSCATITVKTEPGQGTTFSILFPRYLEAPVSLEPQKIAPPVGGTETILLVEDSEALRELTCNLLQASGYTVLDAGDPAEAIRIADRYDGPLPILITDIVLPGINGRVLAATLLRTRPQMRVLYTSGFIESPAPGDEAYESNCAFLEKPFSRDQLISVVRQLLDAPNILAA